MSHSDRWQLLKMTLNISKNQGQFYGMYKMWHTITVMSKYNYVVDTDSYTQYYNCKGFFTRSIILNWSNTVCLYLYRIEDERMHKMLDISITIGTEFTSLSSFWSEVRWSGINKIHLNELYTSVLMSLSFFLEALSKCVCVSVCPCVMCIFARWMCSSPVSVPVLLSGSADSVRSLGPKEL